ncbi:MAG TPA: hypothetical protein VKG25_20425 [Bryobacteraceae bacterium]|nr:hypothetical protein [Bryobacteraceae bacterium]
MADRLYNGETCMPDHFVRLRCLSCNQELDVYDDMERFFCAHCGAAIFIERRGGAIALRPADKIGPVPYLQDLSRQSNEIRARRTMRKKQGFTAGAALLLTGYVIVRLGIGYLFGLGMLLAGIVVIGYVRRKDKAAQVDARILQAKIDALSGRTG